MKKKLTMTAKNEKFWALTPERQRVAVARDVIRQIGNKFIFPRQQVYFRIEKLESPIENSPTKLDNLFGELKKVNANCEACGIGSCFISLVSLGNNTDTKKYLKPKEINDWDEIDDDPMRVLLRKVFPSHQISLIESAFERDSSFKDDKDKSSTYEERNRAQKFGRKYSSASSRLIAIMQNIIKNKGTFKP